MADATPENWRPVVGHEALYEVSDHGRIRRTGRGRGVRVGLVLWQSGSASTYRRVRLSRGGARRTWLTHRLVLEAFVGPCPPDYNCNHRDGDKANNHLSNLEWVTRSGNTQHALRHGLLAVGERHPNAKLTVAQVAEIRRLQGIKRRGEVAAQFGINRSYVSHLWAGRARKDATSTPGTTTTTTTSTLPAVPVGRSTTSSEEMP